MEHSLWTGPESTNCRKMLQNPPPCFPSSKGLYQCSRPSAPLLRARKVSCLHLPQLLFEGVTQEHQEEGFFFRKAKALQRSSSKAGETARSCRDQDAGTALGAGARRARSPAARRCDLPTRAPFTSAERSRAPPAPTCGGRETGTARRAPRARSGLPRAHRPSPAGRSRAPPRTAPAASASRSARPCGPLRGSGSFGAGRRR